MRHLGYSAEDNMAVVIKSDIAAPDKPTLAEDILYLTHRCCWEIARLQLGDVLSNHALFAIGQRTYPVLPLEDSRHGPESLGAFPDLEKIATDTTLGQLLHGISLLPLEIQHIIATHVARDQVLSLSRACHTAKLYLRPTSSRSSARVETIEVPSSIKSLHICTVYIFGSSYLDNIGFNCLKESDSVAVDDRPIIALQFAIGTYGLRAIRVVYDDESWSPWIGNHDSRCWYGSLPTRNLLGLRMLRDVRIVTKDPSKYGQFLTQSIGSSPSSSFRDRV